MGGISIVCGIYIFFQLVCWFGSLNCDARRFDAVIVDLPL